MSFLAPLLEAAAPSLIGGLVSGGVGAVSNGVLGGAIGANNAFNTGLQIQSMIAQDQLDLQSSVFDEAMAQQSENMREINTLNDVAMQQRKADDGIVKKFIESITQ
ncbi:MAG TPA: hypothetical protein VFN49_05645 [Candidatus Aquilonibacter sp.]|nr:hypothetical protein [Candidatus Aquilonibacter sp.]